MCIYSILWRTYIHLTLNKKYYVFQRFDRTEKIYQSGNKFMPLTDNSFEIIFAD